MWLAGRIIAGVLMQKGSNVNNLNHNRSSENAWVTAQAALSTGTPSHLASYPPYASTGQSNINPPHGDADELI